MGLLALLAHVVRWLRSRGYKGQHFQGPNPNLMFDVQEQLQQILSDLQAQYIGLSFLLLLFRLLL